MVDTPPQTDTYNTALDIFDRTHPLRVDVDENLKVTGIVTTVPSGTQDVRVVNTPNVDVANFPASQTVTESNVDKSFGTWAYYGGTSGTVIVSAGQRALSMSCHSTSGGTMQINGGQTIPVPANVGFAINPLGNIVAPTIVFSSTDSYFVEVVS
jgi:hypothetical protein